MPAGYGIGYDNAPSPWIGSAGTYLSFVQKPSSGVLSANNGWGGMGEGGGYSPSPTQPVPRITIPQDATQTEEQLENGRKKIKLPEGGVMLALVAAVLLLPALLK